MDEKLTYYPAMGNINSSWSSRSVLQVLVFTVLWTSASKSPGASFTQTARPRWWRSWSATVRRTWSTERLRRRCLPPGYLLRCHVYPSVPSTCFLVERSHPSRRRQRSSSLAESPHLKKTPTTLLSRYRCRDKRTLAMEPFESIFIFVLFSFIGMTSTRETLYFKLYGNIFLWSLL